MPEDCVPAAIRVANHERAAHIRIAHAARDVAVARDDAPLDAPAPHRRATRRATVRDHAVEHLAVYVFVCPDAPAHVLGVTRVVSSPRMAVRQRKTLHDGIVGVVEADAPHGAVPASVRLAARRVSQPLDDALPRSGAFQDDAFGVCDGHAVGRARVERAAFVIDALRRMDDGVVVVRRGIDGRLKGLLRRRGRGSRTVRRPSPTRACSWPRFLQAAASAT